MSEFWRAATLQLDDPDNGEVPCRQLLQDLVDGSIPVLVLRGAFSGDCVTRNRTAVSGLFHTATTTRYANGSLTTVGPYLAKYLSARETYFSEAADAQSRLSQVGFDLTVMTRQALSRLFGLNSFEPAVEPDGHRYAEQNVRIYPVGNRTPMHNDNIMRDAKGTGLMLADLICQLSCVVCIQECDEGGELQVYRKMWEPADEKHKAVGDLGYYEGLAAGAACHRFKPRTGDVYVLNPTHYHSIERVGGRDRVTMGFFFGFFDQAMTDAVGWV